MGIELRITRPAVATRCAWCHDDLSGGGPTMRCPRCSSRLHRECALIQGGCATLGCRVRVPHELPPRPQRSPRVALAWGLAGALTALLLATLASGWSPSAPPRPGKPDYSAPRAPLYGFRTDNGR